jgi:hypothetical protein
MTGQTKRNSSEARLATCLAIAVVLVAGGVTAARANAVKDSGRGVRAAAASTRNPAVKQGRRRLAEERAMVNALAEKRDPFKVPPPPPPGGGGDGLEGPLPPGSRGLVIGRMILKGIVREDASNTMIAVVTNRSNLAYFLRVHDQVYNGVVTRITADSIHFAEDRLDTGGRVETLEVVLKLDSERQEGR